MMIRPKLFLIIGLGAVLMYALALGLLFFFQDFLIFQPPHGSLESCPGLKNLGYEVAPGRLYIKRKAGARGWLLLFHGNAESACSNLHYHDAHLADLPVNLAFAEYPGYAGDKIPASQPRILMGALTALENVELLNTTRLPVIIMGESLGSGVATYLASKVNIKALVVRSPYTSILDVAQSIYPWVPVKYLLRHSFKADIWAAQVKVPVLALHGRLDRTIPFKLGDTQAHHFPSLIRFIDLHDAGHNDVWEVEEGLALKALKDFILGVIQAGHADQPNP